MAKDIYNARCNDVAEYRKWHLVAVSLDTLCSGEEFEAIDGSLWIKRRKTASGTVICDRLGGGDPDTFCLFASVRRTGYRNG